MGNENGEYSAPDLSSLLNPQAPADDGQNEAEDAAASLLHSIKISLEERDTKIAGLAVEVRMLKNRLSTMETFVSYLLEKDPGMQERVKAMAAAATPAKAPDNVAP